MGLEAMLPREIPENIMMNMEKTSPELLSSPISLMPLAAMTFDNSSAETEADTDNQMQLFLQAHALLKKGRLYQQINGALKRSVVFRPNVSQLPQTLELQDSDDRETVTSLHRDAAVSNIRFLNIFYGFSAKTFALAVNLLDRVICKVKAHPKYLSCIATSCFYIAARTQVQNHNVFIPTPAELVKLSQCGGTDSDLYRMQNVILEKVEGQVESVTPLTFLLLFHELFANSGDKRLSSPHLLNSLIAKLEVLMCQFEFAKYRAETLALSLLSCMLQDTGALQDMQHFSTLVELQCYCQMSDAEFLQCRNLVLDYLQMYVSQPSKLPRLQLVWTVSRRTMNKMKPSTKVLCELEPIWEDEDIEDEADAGKFDSENSDSELEKRNQLQQAINHLPTTVPRPRALPLSHNNNTTAAATTECKSPDQSFSSTAPSRGDDNLDEGGDDDAARDEWDEYDEVFINDDDVEDDDSEGKAPPEDATATAGILDSDANNNVKLKGFAVSVYGNEKYDSKSNM